MNKIVALNQAEINSVAGGNILGFVKNHPYLTAIAAVGLVAGAGLAAYGISSLAASCVGGYETLGMVVVATFRKVVNQEVTGLSRESLLSVAQDPGLKIVGVTANGHYRLRLNTDE